MFDSHVPAGGNRQDTMERLRDLVTDSSDLAIVSAIIAIARHLQIQVIAEGIEGYQ